MALVKLKKKNLKNNTILVRSSRSKMFFKIVVSKERKFHKKAPVLKSLFNNVVGL